MVVDDHMSCTRAWRVFDVAESGLILGKVISSCTRRLLSACPVRRGPASDRPSCGRMTSSTTRRLDR